MSAANDESSREAATSTAGLEGHVYAVACSLSKIEGNVYSTTMTLHTRLAANEDEAKGSAVAEALTVKPGYGVTDVLCLLVKMPTSSNAE